MTSVIPVHSALRAIALACWGSNPALRKISRVISVARSAVSFRFSRSSSSRAPDECARSTPTRDSSSPWSWAHHGALGSTFTSISPHTCSATPQQVLLVAEMPVQGHRRDAQVLRELADGQRVEPVGVGDLERGVRHHALAEPGPFAVRLF